jgi:hypothetical protein
MAKTRVSRIRADGLIASPVVVNFFLAPSSRPASQPGRRNRGHARRQRLHQSVSREAILSPDDEEEKAALKGGFHNSPSWECGLGLPKRNGARQRSRTRPNGMAVIAALHDPLTVLVADDLAHVVTPDHDGSD